MSIAERKRLFRKLCLLERRGWVDLLQAQLALIRAQITIWVRQRGQLVTKKNGSPDIIPLSGDVAPEVRRLALAVERAANYGVFRPKCLVRAMALNWILQSHGYHGGAVRVGVTRRRGKMEAHAWVEYDGVVVGDREWHIRRFDGLDGAEVS